MAPGTVGVNGVCGGGGDEGGGRGGWMNGGNDRQTSEKYCQSSLFVKVLWWNNRETVRKSMLCPVGLVNGANTAV